MKKRIKNKILRMLDLHFKTDCLACEMHGKCDDEHKRKCEVARTYFDIVNEVEYA